MFARIIKSSLTSLRLPTQHKLLPLLSRPRLTYTQPFYTFSSTTSQYQNQAQSAMKEFLERESVSGPEVIQALDSLASAKLGINSSDVTFKTFMMRLNDTVRGKLTAQQLEAIALRAHSLNIKDPLFWFSLDNTIKASDSNVDLNTLLVLFSTFLRVKAYPQFIRYLSAMQADFSEAIKQALADLDFRSLIHASYIFASLDTPFPDLTKKLKNELRSSLKNPTSADISINELATVSALLPVLLKDNDADKQELISGLGKFLEGQDLSQYTKVTQGEESLTWQSVAFLLRTYSLPKYRNEKLVGKLNDMVLQKAENDVIDFDSASILLSVLSDQSSANKIIEKVLEMVHTQLANEGALMFNEFDGRNVSAFLRSVIALAKKGIDKETVEELIDYFQGLVMSNKIATKIEPEEYNALTKIFEDAKGVGNVDARVFEHIQRRLEYIAAQRKRESEQGQGQ